MITPSRSNSERLVSTGEWDNGATTWEFWRSNLHPDPKLCSAVGLVAIIDVRTSSVVLTLNERGWEMIAGGIDLSESPGEALEREALEEGGFVVARPVLFGYRKIENRIVTEKTKGYPPLAYMPYHYAFTDEPLRPAYGKEIIDSGVFSLDDEDTRALLEPDEFLLIEAGLRAAREAHAA